MTLFFPSLEISRADWGDDWPLTIDAGALQLRSGNRVVFLTQGKVHGVNGLARQEHHILPWKGLRYRPIDEILADDPERPGFKKSLNRLINAGLALGKAD